MTPSSRIPGGTCHDDADNQPESATIDPPFTLGDVDTRNQEYTSRPAPVGSAPGFTVNTGCKLLVTDPFAGDALVAAVGFSYSHNSNAIDENFLYV